MYVFFSFPFLGSGKFSTSNQGNSLRLFALQAVSADAMRKVFKNESDFKEKKEKLQNDFKIQKINDLKSRKYVILVY